MNSRETIYYGVSRCFWWLLQNKFAIKFFSFFNFQKSNKRQITISLLQWLIRQGIFVYLSTVFLLFFVNAVWSYFTGRLFVDDLPNTRTFSEDIPNIINYLILCPIYVTMGMAFLSHIFDLKSNLFDSGLLKNLNLSHETQSTNLQRNLFFLIAIFFSLISIPIYYTEIPKYDFIFWFSANVDNPVLKAHELYYIITNVLLLLIVLFTASMHFELFSISAIIGKKLRELYRDDNKIPEYLLNQEQIIDAFAPFSSLYVISKILILAILANMYTWKAQQVDFIGMLDVSIVLTALLGAAIISYPRYHIQYWLFKIWDKEGKYEYPEIRKPLAVGIANIADILIIGSAMTNLVLYTIKKII